MSNGRLALKYSLLMAPAVLVCATLGFGQNLAHAIRVFFASKGVTVKLDGQLTLDVPDRSWTEPARLFTVAFLQRFPRENPFTNEGRDPSAYAVQHPPAPLTHSLLITLVRDPDVFQRETKSQTGAYLPYNDGYFHHSLNQILINVERRGLEDDGRALPEAMRVALSHELTHAILHYSYSPDPAFSPWLSEGIAQWCETVHTDVKLGTLNTRHLREARGGLRPGDLRVIVAAPLAAFQSEGNAVYYSASYALVAYLLSDPRLADRFRAYFDEETAPGALDAGPAFSKLIGPVAEVESAWFTWLRRQ